MSLRAFDVRDNYHRDRRDRLMAPWAHVFTIWTQGRSDSERYALYPRASSSARRHKRKWTLPTALSTQPKACGFRRIRLASSRKTSPTSPRQVFALARLLSQASVESSRRL